MLSGAPLGAGRDFSAGFRDFSAAGRSFFIDGGVGIFRLGEGAPVSVFAGRPRSFT